MFVSNSAPQSIQRVFDNSISSSNEKYIQFLENKILNVQQKLEDLYEKDISDEEQLIEEIDKLQSMESKYVNLLRKKQMEIKMDIARSHAMSVQFNNMNNISFNQPHQQNLVSTTAEPHYEEHPDTDNNNEQADESTPNRYQRLLGSEPFYMNNKIGMEDTHIQTENDEQPPATNQTPIVLQRDPVDTADQPSNKNSAREIVKNGIESKIKMMMEARAQKETSDAGIVRIEAEKEAKIDAEKKAKREAEAKARREAESKAAAVAAEKARKEAEAKVTIERAKKEDAN
ncbi:hypothetical protein TBLA_0B05280 [Henningerozyma blattae CBS 6284]|uniref:Uncharacterized protein n=1 Tax=Henningerozyma blattae (strain ATCC 34711 / CBS 6284 / DSM 70876 / NBRC 10599 / NRRL Y-10934 / UCD 77-7) TaxID=1071380 RepID=I2GZ08_HENB6|nr:hypothetical protein TBLA_0B05280 [Tetrapisispora blattae CBS 6284]CCH59360.1 hypothetical protein TBLA_0B05280 [Tetrapisispora blattae CBS 6284]